MSGIKRQYVVVRTYSAGVHAGYLVSRKGQEVRLVEARRIWYWKGAASLSEMAVRGVNRPLQCKFSVPVPMIDLTQAIEVIFCTQKARKNIQAVNAWVA